MGKKKIILGIFILILSLISALRGGTNDTPLYVEIFHNVDLSDGAAYITEKYSVEYLFALVTHLLRLVTNDVVEIYFFIICLTSLLFIYKAAANFRLKPSECLLIFSGGYFWLMFMSQMRYGLAIALAYYAISLYFKDSKNVFYTTSYLFLGLLFHSSIVLLMISMLVYFLIVNYLNSRAVFILIFISIIISSLVLLKVLSHIDIWKIQYYLNNDDFNSETDIFRFTNIKYIIIEIIALAVYKKNSKSEQKILNLFCFLTTINLGIRLGFSEVSIISGRVASLFSFAEIFYIPFFIQQIGLLKKHSFIICLLISLASGCYTMFVSQKYIAELYFTK